MSLALSVIILWRIGVQNAVHDAVSFGFVDGVLGTIGGRGVAGFLEFVVLNPTKATRGSASKMHASSTPRNSSC